jgi:hypothetical protein
VLPILVFACATLVFLYQPGITPHQPYASRRLVPAVLPGLILLAVWLASWLAQRSRVVHLVDVPDYLKRAPRALVIFCCAAVICAPPAIGNLGGLAFKSTWVGEIAAMNRLCQGIPKGSSVLVIDNNLFQGFGQTIRGMCNVPVAAVHTTIQESVIPDKGNDVPAAKIIAAVRAIEVSGHHPFLLAISETEFAPLTKQFGNGTSSALMVLNVNDDAHMLYGAPRDTGPETFTVFSWAPAK